MPNVLNKYNSTHVLQNDFLSCLHSYRKIIRSNTGNTKQSYYDKRLLRRFNVL